MSSKVFVDWCLTRKCTKNPSDFPYTLFKYKTSIVLVYNGATLHLIKYFFMLKQTDFPSYKRSAGVCVHHSVRMHLDACSRSGVRGADEDWVGDLHAVSVVELGGPLADG